MLSQVHITIRCSGRGGPGPGIAGEANGKDKKSSTAILQSITARWRGVGLWVVLDGW